jgi:hypothetical protein
MAMLSQFMHAHTKSPFHIPFMKLCYDDSLQFGVLTVPKVLWRGEAVEPLSEGVGVVVEGL